MHIAVLCPGPSLARFDVTRRHDFRIGVNRAILRPGADCVWWAASDEPTIALNAAAVAEMPTRHRPRCCFTNASAFAKPAIRGILDSLGLGTLTKEELTDRFPAVPSPPAVGWTCYTSTSALILAAALGAKQIDLIGADLRGVRDWDGQRLIIPGSSDDQAERLRSETRWASEAGLIRQTIDLLARRYITVNWIRPERTDGHDG
jgi:hypothetical protein